MTTGIRFLALLFIPAIVYASPSRMKIGADNEPGQRILITGHVFGADGKPRSGIQLYAYHTDAKGLYRPDGSSGEPRLRGTLLTAADGSYEIDTIKPAPYPHRDIPAHIHVHLRWLDKDQEEEIRFEGSGPHICHLVQNRCTVDFRLRP